MNTQNSIEVVERPTRKPRKPRKAPKRPVARRKPLKRKPTTTTKADRLFSEFIRKRDARCVYPGCEEKDIKRLQCSHFFARAISSTRYDPENCDALCYKHHYGDRIRGWEYLKQTEYRDFKLAQLGENRYHALTLRATITVKRGDAIKTFIASIEGTQTEERESPSMSILQS